MIPTHSLALVAAWFLCGMARIVLSSKLAEHRVDNPDPSMAIAFTMAAASERTNAANYDPMGRRLLPWYRAVSSTYWVVAVGACVWAVFHA